MADSEIDIDPDLLRRRDCDHRVDRGAGIALAREADKATVLCLLRQQPLQIASDRIGVLLRRNRRGKRRQAPALPAASRSRSGGEPAWQQKTAHASGGSNLRKRRESM